MPDTTAGDSVDYSADEIEYDTRSKTITMLGNAHVRYGGMELTAYRIRFITEHDLVVAEAHAEGDSIVGMPRFSSGAESFTGTRMSYNIRTRRGVVEGGQSIAPEGIYEGKRIKRSGEEQVDVYRGVYTTCDHDPPHYVFEGTKMRVLVGDKVIARPIVMKVADVPVAWLPFGVFFINKNRRSGFISPRTGERASNGRFMYGLGYYVVPNDYLGSKVTLDVDERAGFGWQSVTQYAFRYHLRGNVSTDYFRRWDTPQQRGSRRWMLSAQHQQELSPRARLTANIRYTSSKTPGDGTNVSQAEMLDQSYTSIIGYSQSWESGYSMRANVTHSENLQTRRLDQTLPSLSVSSGQRYFFAEPKRRGPRARKPAGQPPWYRRLGYSWNWNGRNTRNRSGTSQTMYDTWELKEQRVDSTVTYQLSLFRQYGVTPYTGGFRVTIRDQAGEIISGRVREAGPDSLILYTFAGTDSGVAVRDGDNRLRVRLPTFDSMSAWTRLSVKDIYTQVTNQNASLSLPLPTPRWLNVTPSLNWGASWTSRPDSASPQTVHTFSGGVSSNATFYGMFPVNTGPLIAFRHIFTPSASFRYVVRRDLRGGRYIFGGRQVGGDTSRVLNLNVRNVLQMKARWKGEERKFNQLLTVSTGIRYNRDAIGRRWSDPATSVQFLPSNLFDVRLTATHTLYDVSLDSTNVPRYRLNWTHPRLMSVSINTSLRFAGGGAQPKDVGDEGYTSQEHEPLSGRGLQERPLGEGLRASKTPSAFSGWELNLRHTYSWRRRDPITSFSRVPTDELDLSLSFSPWREWWVEASTHYNIRDNRRDNDRIVITRRLHCWQAQLRWIPRGVDRGYYFVIRIINLPDVKIESASDNQASTRR